jgi:hypothetical protein
MESNQEDAMVEEPYRSMYKILDELNQYEELIEFQIQFETDMPDMVWNMQIYNDIHKQLCRINNEKINQLMDDVKPYIRDVSEHLTSAVDPDSYVIGVATLERIVEMVKTMHFREKKKIVDLLRMKFIRMIANQEIFDATISTMAGIIDQL